MRPVLVQPVEVVRLPFEPLREEAALVDVVHDELRQQVDDHRCVPAVDAAREQDGAPLFGFVLAGVRDHEVGLASGVLNAVQQLAGALGIAVIGTIFFSVATKHGMTAAAAPSTRWRRPFATGPRAVRAPTREAGRREHPRRPRAPHHLPVRPAGRDRAARRAAAARAAQPHADPVLLAARRARRPLPQLAAGPVRQLPGPARVPGAGRRADDHGRPGRRHDGHQPVRLLRRGVRRALPVRLRRRARARPRALPRARRPPDRCSTRGSAERDAARQDGAADRRLPGRAQPARLQQRHRLHDPHGARRADARGDARAGARLVPRHRRGCSCRCCATSGSRPASSPATSCSSPPTTAARRAGRAGRRLHRPPRLGRGVRARRRLDRPRPDVRPVRRRGPHPARLHAASRRPPRPSRARPSRARSRFDVRQRGHPRSTRTRGSPCPYTDEQWAAIDALGAAVDARLAAGDVRLTMGGEPTFVSVDDMDGAEWNTTADGDDKRGLAGGLTRRLRRRLRARRRCSTPGRASGTRASRCPAGRSASTGAPTACRCGATASCSPTRRDPAHGEPRRRRATLAAGASPPALGLPGDAVARRATRTRWPRLVAEARRPSGDPPERPPTTRVAAPSRPTLDATPATRSAGCCRCTRAPSDGGGWATGRVARCAAAAWSCIPGDSPMGLRLPLDSLTWTPDARRPRAARPFDRATPPPLPGRWRRRSTRPRRRPRRWSRRRRRRPRCASSCATGTSTCSCRRSTHFETPSSCSPRSRRPRRRGLPGRPRGLPAAARPAPAHARRHARPRRHRGQRAPGRVVGRAGRASRRRCTTTARESRLGTEKFELDGTHTGTGGGNHITLGGADAGRQPAAAPARPAAQPASPTGSTTRRCPTCSPGGSSARPARRPASTRAATRRSYELEIAFGELDRLGPTDAAAVAGRPAAPPPARRRHRQHPPGRVLHRQAVQPRRRAGPARPASSCAAFEMPPHPRMALVQALLVRALVARFWDEPVPRPARALGHRAARPLPAARDVAADIAEVRRRPARATGSRSTHAWLDAVPRVPLPAPRRGRRSTGVQHRAARRDRAVARARRGGHRDGAPPATSTRRSSGSRSRVDGPRRPARHVVTCNGARRPAAADRRARRRASPACATGPGSRRRRCTRRSGSTPRWSSTSSTAGTAGRSAAARTTSCTPAAGPTRPSRSTPTRPRPAGASRFEAHGHTPGPVDVPQSQGPGDYPRTLDLRRA